jgi:AcrR family transcriptional regulator
VVDTRDSLLRAASQLLDEEGPDALTVRRIAAAAGVSTMGVYSRFGNKDGVVDALLCDGFEDLLTAMQSVPDTDDPLADLQASCVAYRAFALEHPTHYRIMFGGAVPGFEPSTACRATGQSGFAALVDRVQRCLDAGLLTGGTATEISASLWATSHGLVSLELFGHRPEVVVEDDPYERTVAAVIRGFRA